MRLLAVGEGLGPTGYARAMEGLLGPLSRAFDVTLFATNHRGPPEPRPFAVRTNRVAGDPYGYEQLPAVLAEVRPDVVLLHRDSTFYAIHRTTLERYRAARVIVYCPADWPTLPRLVPASLASVDRLVVYTQAGRRHLARAFGDAGLAPPPTAVIPHGVDTYRFAPLVPGDPVESRRRARRQLGLGDGFVVLNANRNQRRKRIDLTLRGFALFARAHADARLYLHMGMRDLGCDVARLADELGIADRLITTTREPDPPAVPDAQLNLIYNACDVGLNTAAAEGFGLVSFEHGATGAAQVVPGVGACAELWRGHAVVVATDPATSVVSPQAVAAALARARATPALGERAHAHATSRRFNWSAIAERWHETLLQPKMTS